MDHFRKIAPILGLFTLILSACSYKSPDFSGALAALRQSLREIETCDNPDHRMPVSGALGASIKIQDEIPNMDIEYSDCAGQVTRRVHGPIRMLNKSISIPRPESIQGEVNYVEIENLRTCTTKRYKARIVPRATDGATGIVSAHGQQVLAALYPVNADGDITLPLTNSTLIFESIDRINVREGRNLILVRYYGACLEYHSDRDKVDSDPANCQRAKELGRTEYLVEVQITRPEVAGTHSERAYCQ